MKINIQLALLAVAILTAGCATKPQQAIYLDRNSPALQATRLGIAMTALPKVDVRLPGIGVGCLLCMAAASVSNSTLSAYVRTLPYEDLPQIKQHIADSLLKKGTNVTVIEEDLNVETLTQFRAHGPNIASKDFSHLRQKYDIDKLLVIDIETLGVSRSYATYFATGNPTVVLQGAGYVINLKNNAYEWYMPVNIVRSSDGNWDEPPAYPGLTHAYLQALKTGRDNFIRPFLN